MQEIQKITNNKITLTLYKYNNTNNYILDITGTTIKTNKSIKQQFKKKVEYKGQPVNLSLSQAKKIIQEFKEV